MLSLPPGLAAARSTYIGGVPGIPAGADLDGNGTIDLVVPDSDPASSRVMVVLGKGDGTFAPPVDYTAGKQPVAAVLADFNGDGKLDIATANAGSSDVTVLLGEGYGTFGAPIAAALPGGDPPAVPTSLAVGDFNGDGHADLAVGYGGNPDADGFASVLLGNGDGTFQTPAIRLVTGAGPGMVSAGDLNGDGKADLADACTGQTYIYLARADGTFKAAPSVDGDAMIAGDLNGDSRSDLILATPTAVGVRLGQGDGTFAAETDIPVSTNGPARLAVGDFNGDGKPDILVDDPGLPYAEAIAPGGYTILLGAGDGTFRTGGRAPVNFPGPVVLADFNGDGQLDVADVDIISSGVVTVTAGSGDGTLVGPVVTSADYEPTLVRAADLNGDGKLDVVGLAWGGVGVQLGHGDGTFGPPTVYLEDRLMESTAMAIADVNGDGKLDLIVGDETSSDYSHPNPLVSVLLGNGDGTFQPPLDFAIPASPGAPQAIYREASDIVLADLNSDGHLDIVVAANESTGLLLGHGDGTFGPLQFLTTASGSTTVATAGLVVAGDFNGDGKADIATVDSGQLAVFLGRGDGTFLPPTTFPDGSSLADGYDSSLVAGDFNGDGVLDLAVVASDQHNSSSINVFLGKGDGTFRLADHDVFPAPDVAEDYLDQVIVVDMNGDEKPDLVVTGGLTINVLADDTGVGSFAVLLNRGDGSFDPAQTYTTGTTEADGIAAGDFNGDGLTDLLTSDSWYQVLSVFRGTAGGGGGVVNDGPPSPSSGGGVVNDGPPSSSSGGGGGNAPSGNPAVTGSAGTQSPSAPVAPAVVPGPSLVKVERLGVHDQPTRLALSFSKPLDAARANDPANYVVVTAGRDGILGDRDDMVVPVARVVYQPGSRTVTLRTARRINIHHPYRLAVRGTGAGAVTDTVGRSLADGSATITVTWKDIALPKRGGVGFVGPAALRHLVWPRGHR